MALSNNGKKSEAAVHTALKSVQEEVFDFQRMYDAASARNAFMAQVGDFQFFLPGVHGVIEVKSTQHEYRLAKSAFSDNQRAKLRRRVSAGGKVWVAVHHWTTDVWRCVPYDVVHKAFDEGRAASVDLREQSTFGSATEVVVYLIERSISDD